MNNTLLISILLPVAFAVIVFLTPSKLRLLRDAFSFIGASIILCLGFYLFGVKNAELNIPWLGMDINFDLRLYHFNSLIIMAVSVFLFLITIYSFVKMKEHSRAREYYTYLFLTVAFVNGAVLANNFVLLVFFWESLLVTLYGLIAIGNKEAYKTALKSFILVGLCDFCMILGIGILWYLTGSLNMPIAQLETSSSGLAAVSCVLMLIGALGKAGVMPFHTWIPDAATDAPVTVMAFIITVIDKMLGIYLFVRISLDFFVIGMNSALSVFLMILGALTIIFALFMTFVQNNLKRMLAYQSIGEVGYMILGIGSATPIGIAGGIFYMLNQTLFKGGLFLSAGSIEHRTGTTDFDKLGGLKNKMPLTMIGFVICAVACCGLWPFNGFVSEEMVMHGAKETGYMIFMIAAWIGTVLTAASMLKAGQSIFWGKESKELSKVKESELLITLPIIVLALLCIVFGIHNYLPIVMFVEPIFYGYAGFLEHSGFTAHSLNFFNPVAITSFVCLLLGVIVYRYGWSKNNKTAALSSETVHSFPVLKNVYNMAEAKIFDIYEQGLKFLKALGYILYYGVDRVIDFMYEKIIAGTVRVVGAILRFAHNGYYANYLAWCIGGLIIIVAVISLLS
ncbi:MAG: proton-conducting transporter membrane subunit [bacterium]